MEYRIKYKKPKEQQWKTSNQKWTTKSVALSVASALQENGYKVQVIPAD